MNPFLPTSYRPSIWLVGLLAKLKILSTGDAFDKEQHQFPKGSFLNSFFWVVAQSLLAVAASLIILNVFADVGLGRGLHNSYVHSDLMMQSRDVFVNVCLLISCTLGQFTFFSIIVSRSRSLGLRLGPRFWVLPSFATLSLILVLTRQTQLELAPYSGYVPNAQSFALLVALLSSFLFQGRDISK